MRAWHNKILLGNDIIDLNDEKRDPVLRDKFINRICTEREKESICAADNVTLLSFWAAKEAAYKAFSRYDASIIFSPREFIAASNLKVISYRNHDLPLEIEAGGKYIHALCYSDAMDRNRICHWVNNNGDDKANHPISPLSLSALVRLQLKSGVMSTLADISLADIDIRQNNIVQGKKEAPVLHRRNGSSMIVSLSHQGNYFASCAYIQYS